MNAWRYSSPRVGPRSARLLAAGALVVASAVAAVGTAGAAGSHPSAYLSQFSTVTQVGSTVPFNGDVNPYGIAMVTHSDGALVRGDTLISNFNDATNTQGTGTTLVEVSPSGSLTVFATLTDSVSQGCPGGVGLTTALAILPNDYVVVGSLPVDESTGLINGTGCLIVVSPQGNAVAVWSGNNINGPWDMTEASFGAFDELFVTNVLNGTVAAAGAIAPEGTVLRLGVLALPGRTPVLLGSTVVANGFDEQLNTTALVLGPTGVALGAHGTLYVADTINNRVAAIPDATTRASTFPVAQGLTVSSGGSLAQPLGLTTAPNGDLIAVNAANGNAVEVTPGGEQVANVTIDPLNLGGDLFGLVIAPQHNGVLFVDDGNNTLQLLH